MATRFDSRFYRSKQKDTVTEGARGGKSQFRVTRAMDEEEIKFRDEALAAQKAESDAEKATKTGAQKKTTQEPLPQFTEEGFTPQIQGEVEFYRDPALQGGRPYFIGMRDDGSPVLPTDPDYKDFVDEQNNPRRDALEFVPPTERLRQDVAQQAREGAIKAQGEAHVATAQDYYLNLPRFKSYLRTNNPSISDAKLDEMAKDRETYFNWRSNPVNRPVRATRDGFVDIKPSLEDLKVDAAQRVENLIDVAASGDITPPTEDLDDEQRSAVLGATVDALTKRGISRPAAIAKVRGGELDPGKAADAKGYTGNLDDVIAISDEAWPEMQRVVMAKLEDGSSYQEALSDAVSETMTDTDFISTGDGEAVGTKNSATFMGIMTDLNRRIQPELDDRFNREFDQMNQARNAQVGLADVEHQEASDKSKLSDSSKLSLGRKYDDADMGAVDELESMYGNRGGAVGEWHKRMFNLLREGNTAAVRNQAPGLYAEYQGLTQDITEGVRLKAGEDAVETQKEGQRAADRKAVEQDATSRFMRVFWDKTIGAGGRMQWDAVEFPDTPEGIALLNEYGSPANFGDKETILKERDSLVQRTATMRVNQEELVSEAKNGRIGMLEYPSSGQYDDASKPRKYYVDLEQAYPGDPQSQMDALDIWFLGAAGDDLNSGLELGVVNQYELSAEGYAEVKSAYSEKRAVLKKDQAFIDKMNSDAYRDYGAYFGAGEGGVKQPKQKDGEKKQATEEPAPEADEVLREEASRKTRKSYKSEEEADAAYANGKFTKDDIILIDGVEMQWED